MRFEPELESIKTSLQTSLQREASSLAKTLPSFGDQPNIGKSMMMGLDPMVEMTNW